MTTLSAPHRFKSLSLMSVHPFCPTVLDRLQQIGGIRLLTESGGCENVEFRKRSVDRPRCRNAYGLDRGNGPRARPSRAGPVLAPNGRARDDVASSQSGRRGGCSAVII